MIASRPDKMTHMQTVLYEIDMLRYAAGHLQKQTFDNRFQECAYIECFLVHYRNMLEFFGREPKRDDLSVLRAEVLWRDRDGNVVAPVPEKALRDLFNRPLWEKYEDREATGNQTISRYLQHCTEQRIVPHGWTVDEMMRDLQGTLREFEKLIPQALADGPFGGRHETVVFMGPTSMSTHTGTRHNSLG